MLLISTDGRLFNLAFLRAKNNLKIIIKCDLLLQNDDAAFVVHTT